MLLNSIHIGGIQEAKTNAGFFVIEQINMRNSELVNRRLAKFPQVVLRKGDFVNVQENRHEIFRA
jgi:hypothetical protein